MDSLKCPDARLVDDTKQQVSRRSATTQPMHFLINAATEVSFFGDAYLHAWVGHKVKTTLHYFAFSAAFFSLFFALFLFKCLALGCPPRLGRAQGQSRCTVLGPCLSAPFSLLLLLFECVGLLSVLAVSGAALPRSHLSALLPFSVTHAFVSWRTPLFFSVDYISYTLPFHLSPFSSSFFTPFLLFFSPPLSLPCFAFMMSGFDEIVSIFSKVLGLGLAQSQPQRSRSPVQVSVVLCNTLLVR